MLNKDHVRRAMSRRRDDAHAPLAAHRNEPLHVPHLLAHLATPVPTYSMRCSYFVVRLSYEDPFDMCFLLKLMSIFCSEYVMIAMISRTIVIQSNVSTVFSMRRHSTTKTTRLPILITTTTTTMTIIFENNKQ